MDEVCEIAEECGLDIGNFRKFAPEDLRWRLYWRGMYEPCRNKPGFPEFLCLPFFALEGTFPTGSKRKPCQIFGLASGNDGHYSLGAVGGFNVSQSLAAFLNAYAGTVEEKVEANLLPKWCRQRNLKYDGN